MLCSILPILLLCHILIDTCFSLEVNLIKVNEKDNDWNSIIVNGGFEQDKALVISNRGSLLNVIPTSWSAAHGVSLIAYKSFPKYLQDNAGEIYLAMQSVSGYLTQELHTTNGITLKLTFSVLSYCLTAECVQNGILIYTGTGVPIIPEQSRLIFQYMSNEMNVWIEKTVTFTAPDDTFTLSLNAFSDGPRSSGILLDNIVLDQVSSDIPLGVDSRDVSSQNPTGTPTYTPTSTTKDKPKPKPKPKPALIDSRSNGNGNGSPLKPNNNNNNGYINGNINGNGVDKKPANPFSSKNEILPSTPASEYSSTSTSASSIEEAESDAANAFASHGSVSVMNNNGKSKSSNPNNEDNYTSSGDGGGASTSSNNINTVDVSQGCPLHIRLLDSWGDGWHGAVLLISHATGIRGSLDFGITDNGLVSIEPPAASSSGGNGNGGTDGKSSSLTSWEGIVYLKPGNETVIKIGYAAGATSSSNTNTNMNTVPRESWEMFWEVSFPGSGTGGSYMGRYETVMSLSCASTGNEDDFALTLVDITNEVEHDVCTRCPQTAQQNINININNHEKDRVKDKDIVIINIPEDVKDLAPPTGINNANANNHKKQRRNRRQLQQLNNNINNPDKLDKSATKAAAAATASSSYPITIDLMNSEGRGWYNDTIISTSYTISDNTRSTLLIKGTLCGHSTNEHCIESLPDGDYIFRVSGNLDIRSNENAWTFCGVKGSARQELAFTLVEGNCIPGPWAFANEFISNGNHHNNNEDENETVESIKGYDSSIRFENIANTKLYGMDDNSGSTSSLSHKSSSSSSTNPTKASSDTSSSTSNSEDSYDTNPIITAAQNVVETMHSVMSEHVMAIRNGEIALVDSVIAVGSLFLLALVVTLVVQQRKRSAAAAKSLPKSLSISMYGMEDESNSSSMSSPSRSLSLPPLSPRSPRRKTVRFVLGVTGKALSRSELGESSSHPLITKLEL